MSSDTTNPGWPRYGLVRLRADRLAAIMASRAMSQADLARRTGMNRSTIARLLSGDRNPGPISARRLLDAFPGVAESDLFQSNEEER